MINVRLVRLFQGEVAKCRKEKCRQWKCRQKDVVGSSVLSTFLPFDIFPFDIFALKPFALNRSPILNHLVAVLMIVNYTWRVTQWKWISLLFEHQPLLKNKLVLVISKLHHRSSCWNTSIILKSRQKSSFVDPKSLIVTMKFVNCLMNNAMNLISPCFQHQLSSRNENHTGYLQVLSIITLRRSSNIQSSQLNILRLKNHSLSESSSQLISMWVMDCI